MKRFILGSVGAVVLAMPSLAHAAHTLTARSFTNGAGSDTTTDPAKSEVQGTYAMTFAGGNVNNIAKVDSKTLNLSFDLNADQTTGTEVDPSEWRVESSLAESVVMPATGAATGLTVRMRLVFNGSTVAHGQFPTILNLSAFLSIGNCKVAVETNFNPDGSQTPLKELQTCDTGTRRSKIEGDVLVVTVDDLKDGNVLAASLGFQPSLGPYNSIISAKAFGEIAIQPAGGTVGWASPTFGSAPTATGSSSSGGTTSSSSGGSTTTPSPNNPTKDPGSSSSGDAAPGAASDDSSCSIGIVDSASVPASLAAASFGALAALVMRRRRRR